MLDKKECLFERDEQGELISKVVTLETLDNKPEVKIKPLTRGKILEINNVAKSGTKEEKLNMDNKILLSGLIEPKFTEEELKVMKPQYISAISIAIIGLSLGIEQGEVKKNLQSSILSEENKLKK